MKELINSITHKITQKREQVMRNMEQKELLGRNLRFIFCRWNAGAQGLEEVYHYMHIFLFLFLFKEKIISENRESF